MDAKEKRRIIALGKKLRAFAAKYDMVCYGFDHLGSQYCPTPSASFYRKDNAYSTVTLPFWLMQQMGLEL